MSGSTVWYRDRSNDPPFHLSKKITHARSNAAAFRTLAIFPWNNDSLPLLWDGALANEENEIKWKNMVSEYWDAVVVGAEDTILIFFTDKQRPPIQVSVPTSETASHAGADSDIMCVGWSTSQNAPFDPLVIFSHRRLAYIYNIKEKGIAGYIRGHGGPITAIAINPTRPNLFCTTSRDLTARIYDLEHKVVGQQGQLPPNPPWPPSTQPSDAGAAHGLRLSRGNMEGSGIGRCIVVLMGGRSGGHQAAVLGAAFHTSLPLIATCGMDRAVKIWLVRPDPTLTQIRAEDKPVFSSSQIHNARVLSISWLPSKSHEDLLMSHGAPAIMHVHPNDPQNKAVKLVPGEFAIWRWLGRDRFFPPQEDRPKGWLTTLRGYASDYLESKSYQLVSLYAVHGEQHKVPNLSLFHCRSHDPLIIYSPTRDARSFAIICLSSLEPIAPKPFPLQTQGTTGDDREVSFLPDGVEALSDLPLSWLVGTKETTEKSALINCAMGASGRLIVGVGSLGTLWVWRYKAP